MSTIKHKFTRISLFITILIMSLIVKNYHLFAAVTSYDNTFVANDQYSSDFHTRLNANFSKSLTGGINSISSANIVDGTLASGDFSTAVSPITRTAEGAACEYVYTGLVPATAASLTSNISAGTAYPKGYRCEKTSATSKTYTASRWTYVDIDQNCDFQYSAVTIGAATPSVASNAIRIARVSTDATTINTVSDLRTTSCADGPFSNIKDDSTGATLDDLLKYGRQNRPYSLAGNNPVGYVSGLTVSWDTHTTFKVLSGAAYIGGEYRRVSTDITVTTGNDNPADGTSGLDTSSIAANTNYHVYAVADQADVATYSISYSTTNGTPTGVTTARKIGSIRTDANSLFTSTDIVSTHAIRQEELISGMVRFDGSASAINNSITGRYNVSLLTDNGTGDYTVGWNNDFQTTNYAVSIECDQGGGSGGNARTFTSGVGTLQFITTANNADSAADCANIHVLAVGNRTE